MSYLSPEDVVTALEAAKERRKMRLQSFRKGVKELYLKIRLKNLMTLVKKSP